MSHMCFYVSKLWLKIFSHTTLHRFKVTMVENFSHFTTNSPPLEFPIGLVVLILIIKLGFVKRKHRHIVDTGLSLLAHASTPLSLWDDAFQTSCYLINRLPSLVTKNRTPFEILCFMLERSI
jgi:hypothetical protein